MLIPRKITAELRLLLREYPVVTILGPRQAGKTTLARTALTDHAYSNLEDPETREIAATDPRAYLAQFSGPVIIDEIQRVPTLLSYIQTIVDDKKANGQFVLTGSHQLQLREAIGQSLAGRTAILQLLPLSIQELKAAGIEFPRFENYVFQGLLPRVHDQSQRPATAYANYFQTYVERDVRMLIQLKDAALFEKFMKLLAGRVGQLMDLQSLGNDVGVDSKTIRQWLSILEASFVIFKLPPHFENFGKRAIKSPKYYFIEPGLLCHLLGIRTPEQVSRDPLVGSLFENLVIIEAMKSFTHRGLPPALHFFRDNNGQEIDLLVGDGRYPLPIEIKSSSTFSQSLVTGLRRFQKANVTPAKRAGLIYNGKPMQLSDGIECVPFSEVDLYLQPN